MEQGENAQLPSVLTITKFSAARGKEIQILNKALKSSTGINLAFQKLPTHMRRRAMSHNVKRLPRRLREIHLSQMTKSGLPPKQKRPSRKYRRRPYNLTSEYARRQRTHLWLNTHIWHAKRFHMMEKWGYQLPYRPCDRAFRACYRATTKHCLLQDISYYSCIELVSDINVLVNGFKKITDTNIIAKSVITGLRQGTLTLFDTLKSKPIGPVYFLWRPLSQSETKSLWLWVHPAYHNELLDTLKDVFCVNSCILENNDLIYKDDALEMKVFKHNLSRFRLTGPLSNVVLWNAIKIADKKNMDNGKNLWAKTFLDSKLDYLSEIKERLNMFQFISSPAEFSPYIVLPFVIQDPRFNLPKKRTKPVNFYSDISIETISWNKILDNPLWEECFRNESEHNKPSQATLAKLREKLLVPGSAVPEEPTVLPITLIQRPGKRCKEYHGYGSGWDLILPSAWAQPVWLSLVMWGARAGGLREMDSVTFESDQQQFLLPDTEAGRTEENAMMCQLKETFFKLPPNKRPNFNKFGITSPFNWNWLLLLKEWGCTEDLASNFVVLRCKKLLENLQLLLKTKNPEMSIQGILENALLPVSLKFSQKGSCRKLAIICLPKSEDLSIVPVEPFHEDSNENKRKLCRKEHKDLLKRLKRKRKQGRINGEKIPIDMDVLKSYSTNMKQLWVPDSTAIRHSCSREVMGFVKHGDFSFLLAKTKGIGYITMNSFKKLLELKTDKVLVRNTSSRKYRLAVLDIISEV